MIADDHKKISFYTSDKILAEALNGILAKSPHSDCEKTPDRFKLKVTKIQTQEQSLVQHEHRAGTSFT